MDAEEPGCLRAQASRPMCRSFQAGTPFIGDPYVPQRPQSNLSDPDLQGDADPGWLPASPLSLLDGKPSPDPATRGDGEHRALKICFVLPPMERYYPRSGGAIATVTRHLTGSLLQLGHSVDVLTPDDGEQPYDEGAVLRLRFGPASPPPELLHKSYVLEARAAQVVLAGVRTVSPAGSRLSVPTWDRTRSGDRGQRPRTGLETQSEGHRTSSGPLAAQPVARGKRPADFPTCRPTS